MEILEQIRNILQKPLVVAILGFIIGLIIGLPVLGWGLMPVQWTDADPSYLREDLKADYLRMAMDSYSLTKDEELATQRYEALGEDAEVVLQSLKNDPDSIDKWSEFSQVVTGSMPLAGDETPVPGATAEAATTGEEKEDKPMNLTALGIGLGVSCILLVAIAGALVYMLLIRNQNKGGRTPRPSAVEPYDDAEMTKDYYEDEEDGQSLPVAQFMTTYSLGDDLYDDSFSIDAPSGEFLGECGVGISESIGTGDPKKVTAFEVWLFDKNDIQTVTKVLMSENAMNDSDTRHKLESKGEPILIETDQVVILETATLQLEARLVDMSYGHGALPENSFLDRLMLELAVWQKSTD